MSCPDVMIERFNNVNKSCKVIEVNPPLRFGPIVPTIELRLSLLIDHREKPTELRGTRVIRIS